MAAILPRKIAHDRLIRESLAASRVPTASQCERVVLARGAAAGEGEIRSCDSDDVLVAIEALLDFGTHVSPSDRIVLCDAARELVELGHDKPSTSGGKIMAAGDAVTVSDHTIKELVQELKQTNRTLSDFVKEPQRWYQSHNLEHQFRSAPERLLENLQSMATMWTESVARTVWFLDQYTPANVCAGVTQRLQQMQHAHPAPPR